MLSFLKVLHHSLEFLLRHMQLLAKLLGLLKYTRRHTLSWQFTTYTELKQPVYYTLCTHTEGDNIWVLFSLF